MRSASVHRGVAAAVVILVLSAGQAGAQLNPTDPPERRIQPPVGVTSEVRVQPPVVATAERRIAPPVGVTTQVRLQPPVGVEQSYFEQFMLWLRAQIRPIG
jgi:hypothetical protein